MVFNKIEEVERKRDDASQVVQPVRERLVALLRKNGSTRKIGFLNRLRNEYQSQSYLGVNIVRMRDTSHGLVSTSIKIQTDPSAPEADSPSASSGISVLVQSQGIRAHYHLDPESEKSYRTIGREGANLNDEEEDGWESIAELDDAFLEMVEQALGR